MLFILLILVGYVTYCSIFNIYKPYAELKPIIIILGVIVLTFAFINLKKLIGKIKEKQSNLIAIILCALFFIGLSIVGCLIIVMPSHDLADIIAQVRVMLENGGHFIEQDYFSKYNHQIPMVILIYLVYSFAKFIGFNDVIKFTVIINALFITITALFTYLSVKRLKDYKVGLMTLIFFILNPIFYIDTSYYYGHTLCMPFAAIAIYLFITAMQAKNKKILIISLIFSGIMIALGLKLRATVIIIIIAMIVVIYLFNSLSKKTFICSAVLIIGFILGMNIYSLIEKPFDVSINKELKLPVTHFIVMSLNKNSDGYYTSQDAQLANSIEGYENRNKAMIKVIKHRLNDLGIKGLISFSKLKLSAVWSNGTYEYCTYNLDKVRKVTDLYEYIEGNKKIFVLYYCQIFKAILMLMLTLAIIKEIYAKDKEGIHSVIYISIFGAFLFYLMWEVKMKYSLCFLPWIILLFGIGIEQAEKLLNIKKIKCNLKGKDKVLDFTKMNKIISMATIIITVFFLIINYKSLAVKKNVYYDNRVVQNVERDMCSVSKISNQIIEQEFETDSKFNIINIKFKKEGTTALTHYNIILYNSKRQVMFEKNFTSDDVKNKTYKEFKFKSIKPKGNEKYIIQIYSNDATDNNSIGIASYNLDNYSIYPDCDLFINGKRVDSELTFNVKNKVRRTYVSKKVYILISIVIIAIEIFAFYPYLKKYNKKVIR